MTGKVKSSNYSVVEKKLFLEILKTHSHIIENKKSDSVTLGEKSEAWKSITQNYNGSTLISEKRDVGQLKKLWTNMKTKQRTALTLEKQQRLATGGGPSIPDAEVDPDIMFIAPNLNKTAPILFSSNMSTAEVTAKRDVVNMMECEDYSILEALYEDSDNDESFLNHATTPEENFAEASTCGITGRKTPLIENFESCKEHGKGERTQNWNSEPSFHVTGIKRSAIVSSKSCKRRGKDNTCNEEEKKYTTERLTKIIQHEEKLFCQKLHHEQEIHDLTIAHLEEKYALEIRTATAAANLAELQLLKEQNKDCNTFQYDS